jgi:hypothetical protein
MRKEYVPHTWSWPYASAAWMLLVADHQLLLWPSYLFNLQVSRIWSTDQVTFWDRISCSYFFFR